MSHEFSSKRSRIVAAIFIAALVVILTIVILVVNTMYGSSEVEDDLAALPEDVLSATDSTGFSFDEDALVWTNSHLRNGEALSTFFDRMDVPDTLRPPLISALKSQIDIRKMPAGTEIDLGWEGLRLQRVDFSHGRFDSVLQAGRNGDEFVAQWVVLPSDTLLAYYEGEIPIGGSVYESIVAGRGNARLAIKFFEVFQFTHYFAVDTRRGDRFSFVVEEIWREDERVGFGNILAARYAGEFDTLTAVFKADGIGAGELFDAEGETFRRDLLRVPFPAARITSTYGVRRHPISGQVKMHHGVDLAADRGTPVVAAGKGVVTKAEYGHPGYGNWVHIKHGDSGFETRYGHFQKIAKRIRAGVHVDQGTVIGYVGSTGHATGPHLHYEVFRDGQRMNPLKVKGSPVQRIDGEELALFLDQVYRPWSFVLDQGDEHWRMLYPATAMPMPSVLTTALASSAP